MKSITCDNCGDSFEKYPSQIRETNYCTWDCFINRGDSTDNESGEECPLCKQKKERLGCHWRMSSICDYPEYPSHLHSVVEGLLLGDGSINVKGDGHNGVLAVEMTNPRFIEHLDEVFGPFSRGFKLKHTAEEKANMHMESGFNPSANSDTYRDMYRFTSRAHPYLTRENDRWYDNKKEFPEDLELDPVSAKHWYAGDGGLVWKKNGTASVAIACKSQIERQDYLENVFEDKGFEVHITTGKVQLGVEGSREFLSWIGDPLPGFEYKWENESRERYRRLMEQSYHIEDKLREVEA